MSLVKMGLVEIGKNKILEKLRKTKLYSKVNCLYYLFVD